MWLAALVACKGAPEEANRDLDDLIHWFFVHFEDGTDDEMRAAGAELDPLLDDAVVTGTVRDLSDEEQAVVELGSPRDIEDATGLFISGPVACTFEDMETVHWYQDQEALYEDRTGGESYDEYDRQFTSDLDAYLARETPILWWETTYTVSPVTTRYTAFIEAGLRYVPESEGVGPLIVERAFLPEPATFEQETEDFFDQDYQIDVALPRDDTSVHVYAMWRDLQSLGLGDEETSIQNIILNGLEDFDRDTDVVCEVGGF